MKAMPREGIREKIAYQVGQLPNGSFEETALEVFRYQARHQPLYREYLTLLQVDANQIQSVDAIPFLPISFFKTHDLKSGSWREELVFSSSGTTGSTTSRHPVRDLQVYLRHTVKGFEFFYGPIEQYAILALLPAYLERSGSSLVAMADHFIRLSGIEQSGFYLNEFDQLIAQLVALQELKLPTILLGVSFALLDLASMGPFQFPDLIVMETGGMKGRRKEMTRMELHQEIQKGLGVPIVHSEYGMTELFSQAYSQANGLYFPGPGMRVSSRDITDPLSRQQYGKTGVLNIIDLANLDTISFIATDDLGRVYPDGSFEVLGRLDYSDVRGCNLLVV